MRTIARCVAAAGIALFSVALGAAPASAGGGCHGPLTDAAGVHIEISALCFSPTVLRVRPGTTVNWANRDGIEHTVTATGGSFDADLQDGQAYSRRFDQSGVFPYYCHFHPGMVGVVFVGDGRATVQGTTTTAIATAAAAGAAAGAGAGPVARSGHHSVGPALTIGALITAAALVALGAWRSLNAGRPQTATPSAP
jgi:plastocyanin